MSDDLKVGGYGAGGCSCSITMQRFCPVHGECVICRAPLGDGPFAYGVGGKMHARCGKLGKAHGREVSADEVRLKLGIKEPSPSASDALRQELQTIMEKMRRHPLSSAGYWLPEIAAALARVSTPPAVPQGLFVGGWNAHCPRCITKTHCAHHHRCLNECVPSDLAPPAV